MVWPMNWDGAAIAGILGPYCERVNENTISSASGRNTKSQFLVSGRWDPSLKTHPPWREAKTSGAKTSLQLRVLCLRLLQNTERGAPTLGKNLRVRAGAS